MGTASPAFCRVFALLLVGGGISFSAGGLLSAGESQSLHVSGQTNTITVPKTGSSGPVFNPSPGLFRRDSSAPAALDDISAPPAPSEPVARNRRLEELIDRQKNWIFLTPETFNSGPTPEDMFSPEGDSAALSGNSSKVIANFWKEQDRLNGLGSPSSVKRSGSASDEKDSPAVLEPSSNPLSSRRSERDSSLNWNGLFNQKGTLNGGLQPRQDIFNGLFDGLGDTLLNATGSSGSPNASSSGKDQTDDFTKLFRGRSSSPSSRGYDPINSLSDSTIEEIHPVTAKTVEDYGRSKPPRLTDGLPRNLNGLTATQGESFDDPSAKLFGLSGSKPAHPQQTQPRYTQPQPAVLELPKRRF
jgi:hypothetical protein